MILNLKSLMKLKKLQMNRKVKMLALNRKVDESIMISNDIEIVVLAIQGEQVKLGINAPKHITVHRREVFDLISNENKQSLNKNTTEFKKIFKK